MKSSSRDAGDWKAVLMMWGSGEVAMRRVVAQRRRDHDRRAHLVSQTKLFTLAIVRR